MADEGAAHAATAGGRHLAYLEGGDPDGPLVIHNHGGPSSRLEVRMLAESAAKNRELGVTGWSEGGPWALAAADGHFIAVGEGDQIFAIAAQDPGA